MKSCPASFRTNHICKNLDSLVTIPTTTYIKLESGQELGPRPREVTSQIPFLFSPSFLFMFLFLRSSFSHSPFLVFFLPVVLHGFKIIGNQSDGIVYFDDYWLLELYIHNSGYRRVIILEVVKHSEIWYIEIFTVQLMLILYMS